MGVTSEHRKVTDSSAKHMIPKEKIPDYVNAVTTKENW
jgi:hypothetical protein